MIGTAHTPHTDAHHTRPPLHTPYPAAARAHNRMSVSTLWHLSTMHRRHADVVQTCPMSPTPCSNVHTKWIVAINILAINILAQLNPSGRRKFGGGG
mmetsp:Transcript_37389/g.93404  ORF Transcript_37389/g.93404 Transcript_37389/m.93404 type:complete len:97 (+) Transcript_37389:47-337(+)